MFKLMLLDDEAIVLQGIQKVFDLAGYGFEVVGAYQDGRCALEDLEEKKPDLVITDIKMPAMTGIEFVSEAKKKLPEAEFVILSGYGDFVFAKEALKLGVADYLLKPIEKQQFSQMLEKMADKIRQKQEEQTYASSINSWIQNNKEELKNQFLISLAEENNFDESLYQVIKEELPIDQTTPFIMIKIETYHTQFQGDYLSEVGKLAIELNQELVTYGRVEQFMLDESVVVLVCANVAKADYEDRWKTEANILEKVYQPIKFIIKRTLQDYTKRKIQLIAGISKIHYGLGQVFGARNECIQAIFLQEANLNDSMQMIKKVGLEVGSHMTYEALEKLFLSINGGADRKELAEEIDKIYAKVQKDPQSGSQDLLSTTTFLILLRIYQQQMRLESKPQIVDISLLEFQNIQQKYPGLDAQKKLSLELSYGLSQAMNVSSGGTSNKIIADALAYIEENYEKNLSLQTVADAIDISKNYLSNLFKKELDITFVNYLTGFRIEKAKELLKEGRLKMYEVAEAVGYNDYAYFSQIFKKHTGVTLSAFRSHGA